MSNHYRIKNGVIERDKPLQFCFDDKEFSGYKGDTLASAMLANGVRLVGRSFKYHRPRGIMTAGTEEPNALVTLNSKQFQEPNIQATTIELYQGLQCYSQNYRFSLNYDLMAINDLFSRFLGVGFYYKTFMWPKSFWEKIYEPLIRKAAGLGELSKIADNSTYKKAALHCDILVIGAGPAGIIAALNAARAGLNTVIADDDFQIGGSLIKDDTIINKQRANEWIKDIVKELQYHKVKIMKRTTVFAVYDHGIYGALERRTDNKIPQENNIRHVVWKIFAKRSILCTGATERHIVFNQNDRPGIMLANSVKIYAKRYAVACGRNITVFTNNDSGWHMAKNILESCINIEAIIDCRDIKPIYKFAHTQIHMAKNIVGTMGRTSLNSIVLNDGTIINTDCLAVAGGWNPTLQLACHQSARPVWRDEIASFVPDDKNLPQGMTVAGSATGEMKLGKILVQTQDKISDIIASLTGKKIKQQEYKIDNEQEYNIKPYFFVEKTKQTTKLAFVDFQNDVTLKDMEIACQEGFHSPEHAKRYTTLGMATDQGKSSNVIALGIISKITNRKIEQIGTTTYRPPYTPVPIASFAGRNRGKYYRPFRLPPSHKWAKENNAVFIEAGMWLRAQFFPRKHEKNWRETVDREVQTVRSSLGVCDVSTLGKIDIKGKDSTKFLDFVYANEFSKLTVGKTKYGLMLREDGIVMDDGTTARIGENHFVMTTTTANAKSVFRHLEFCRQCLMPYSDVHLQSITDYYAQYAIAGPNSRNLLRKIIDKQYDISNDVFPFMACREITIFNGIPARLFRISFSGELAYEIAVPARYGDSLIRQIMKIGQVFNITPYGTEALGVMRIEKGHPAGGELNGQIGAHHLSMERLLSSKKDFIGNTLAKRKALVDEDGIRIVGVKPANQTQKLYCGAHFIKLGEDKIMQNDKGWISSVAYSPTLGHYIGLAFLKRGKKLIGQKIRAVSFLHDSDIVVDIINPHMLDPQGKRLQR